MVICACTYVKDESGRGSLQQDQVHAVAAAEITTLAVADDTSKKRGKRGETDYLGMNSRQTREPRCMDPQKFRGPYAMKKGFRLRRWRKEKSGVCTGAGAASARFFVSVPSCVSVSIPLA